MQWERRKPLWPRLAAVGLLFVLALAAPFNWRTSESTNVQKSAASLPSVDSTRRPPYQATDLERSVDYPKFAETSSVPTPTITTTSQSGTSQSDDFPHAPVPSLAEELPVQRHFDLDVLLKVRDRLLALVDQLPEPTENKPESPTPLTQSRSPELSFIPPVRVTSESDRLAMAPPRASRSILKRAVTITAPTTSRDEEDLEAVIAEAQTQLESVLSTMPIPRIAAVPSLANAPQPRQPSSITKAPTYSQSADTAPTLASPSKPEPRATPVPTQPALRHRPQALIDQLHDFSPGSPGAVWSQRVLTVVNSLASRSQSDRLKPDDALHELEALHTLALQSLDQSESTSYIDQWQQASRALGRRLMVWRMLLDPKQPRVIESSPATVALTPLLNKLASRLETHSAGADWSEYLRLSEITELTSDGIQPPTLARAKLAQDILSRMSSSELTEAQREFLEIEEFQQLRIALRPWAAGKVNLDTLAALIERYESGRQNRYAEAIAQLQQRLKWSDDPEHQRLAEHLELHYRGANMRIAMSDFLMNRMLPQQKPTVAPVRDSIAGAKVRGRSRTTTQLRVRLHPDTEAWHVSLEANGKVYSHTRSDTWPARIRNAARLQYQGRKDITISQQGVSTSPARATAKGRNELVGVDSQLDPVPILGHMLRDMARKKHKKARPAANSQAKAKVVRQVKQRMDSSLNEKVAAFEQKFRDKVLAPIEELALLAEPLDIYTTEERAVMQLRLANTGQLAAHTNRPYAPSDSVLSVQMHESALNNAMLGLGLDGRRMTMLELFESLTTRFGRPDATPPEDMPQRAVIRFAKRDAVRVQCDDDRLELVLSVAELSHRRDKIKNFEIHVHFRPVLSGLSVKLVRDGTLQFAGRRLKTGPRVVLHSILGKVLQEDQQYTLVSPKLMLDPRFAGLMVTQLVLEDGWIGIAIGPAHARRTALRSPTPEVLQTPFVR